MPERGEIRGMNIIIYRVSILVCCQLPLDDASDVSGNSTAEISPRPTNVCSTMGNDHELAAMVNQRDARIPLYTMFNKQYLP